MALKICLLAPTGVGKSTAAGLLASQYNGEIIKLAIPLYLLQKIFYKYIGVVIQGQDGELLQFLGDKIQREAPDFLAQKFTQALKKCSSDLIINDDCRPHNYEALKNLGFIFIKIEGPTRKRSTDHAPLNPQASVEWKEPIPHDHVIQNFGSLEELEQALSKLMKKIYVAHG